MSRTIDIHALHTLPPSNINRDDTGAPKSAIFGGVVRQRVSSQAWKHAIRKDFKARLDHDQLGVRTKRVIDLIVDRLAELDEDWKNDPERSRSAAEGVFSAAGIKFSSPGADADGNTPGAETGYLLFLSRQQIDRAARFLIENDGATPTKRQAKELLDKANSVDIAMFGRMVADAPDYNVDAAVQVAHAIGVHESEPEVDFFTAVDDRVADAEEAGAGMLGTVQMMSSTLYRFASIDLDSLGDNLGSIDAARKAAVAFVRSFIRSLPTGKLNTFANWTFPELVYVTVRDDRAVSLVNAFEAPVSATDAVSRRRAAAEALAAEARSLETAYGLAPVASWIVATGDLGEPFDGLAESTTEAELLSALTGTLETADE